jgi:hypothetical protein
MMMMMMMILAAAAVSLIIVPPLAGSLRVTHFFDPFSSQTFFVSFASHSLSRHGLLQICERCEQPKKKNSDVLLAESVPFGGRTHPISVEPCGSNNNTSA